MRWLLGHPHAHRELTSTRYVGASVRAWAGGTLGIGIRGRGALARWFARAGADRFTRVTWLPGGRFQERRAGGLWRGSRGQK